MSDWSSAQYMIFGNQRTQPSIDLVSRIQGTAPARILDIGCGPGNSTRVLSERFPDAEILGVDSSEDMLANARESYPAQEFLLCNVPRDLNQISGAFDLIFSNACIHWIPEQEQLIRSVFAKLNPGGVFAVQIPFIQEAPFYRLLSVLTGGQKWGKKLSGIRNFYNLLPEEYYDILAGLSGAFEIWQTTYYHVVNSPAAIIGWYKGSGLRPYLDRLSPDERTAFEADLAAEMTAWYKPQKNGAYILKMPRLFFTLTKPAG